MESGRSSTSVGQGSHHHPYYTVGNGYFKEEDVIIDTKLKTNVQNDDINEEFKILEDNKSELEGQGQAGNNIPKDDNNDVLKGKGSGKRHIEFGIEGDESEEDEVEEVELEFENAIPKLHTHNYNAYCLNCDAQITKVVLRRRIPKKILNPSLTTTQHPEEERQLLGCLSCFSLFTHKGKTLHPFPIFGRGNDTDVTGGASSKHFQSIPKSTPKEIGCDPFVMFRRKEENVPGVTLPISTTTNEQTPPLQITSGKSPSTTQEGDRTSPSDVSPAVANAKKLAYETLPLPSVNSGDMSINMRDMPGTSGLSTTLLPITEVQAKSPEIVKSIIYGGLAESITSLSVVSSAAASGAATLSIVALGLANVVGGIFVLAQNLSQLKNDQQEEKYKEALGRKEHFLLHAVIAMISYLVFGLVPPIVYGFSFRETDEKDFKLLAVAVASLICIILLAIGKAYITQAQQFHKFSTYLSYVAYYVTTAAMASGVGYAVGDQAKKLLEKYGWLLRKHQDGSTFLFHGSQTLEPLSFASY